jgi:ferric-dicitrate binding protein FerR (iron transport regulator)
MGTFRQQAICMAVAAMLATWSVATLAAGPAIGTVSALSGSGSGQTDDGGSASASTLSLGADSGIKLDHLQVKSEAGPYSTTLSLLSGYVRAAVARAKGGFQFKIEAPSMVAAVRGTDWIEQFDSGMTQIFVAQGRVRASGTGKYAGDHVLLKAGQGVTFSDTASHTPVVRWKKPKIDLFIAATRIG